MSNSYDQLKALIAENNRLKMENERLQCALRKPTVETFSRDVAEYEAKLAGAPSQ